MANIFISKTISFISNFIEKHYFSIIIVLLICVLGLVVFILSPLIGKIFQPTPSATVPEGIREIVKSGVIGEISENTEGGKKAIELPPIVFNTTGRIVAVEPAQLTVRGSGSNFADQKSRTLIVLFTESTKTTLLDQKQRYQGLDGLKYLKPEMEIMIDGETNIRGKTEIIARYINIIK